MIAHLHWGPQNIHESKYTILIYQYLKHNHKKIYLFYIIGTHSNNVLLWFTKRILGKNWIELESGRNNYSLFGKSKTIRRLWWHTIHDKFNFYTNFPGICFGTPSICMYANDIPNATKLFKIVMYAEDTIRIVPCRFFFNFNNQISIYTIYTIATGLG